MVRSILELPTQHGAIEGEIQNVKTKFYNFYAILSVGYSVNSLKATHFKIWVIIPEHRGLVGKIPNIPDHCGSFF